MEAMGRTQEEIADVRRLSYRREASKQADKLSLLVGDEFNTTLPKEGNVASWPKADSRHVRCDVCYWGQSGHDPRAPQKMSPNDPQATSDVHEAQRAPPCLTTGGCIVVTSTSDNQANADGAAVAAPIGQLEGDRHAQADLDFVCCLRCLGAHGGTIRCPGRRCWEVPNLKGQWVRPFDGNPNNWTRLGGKPPLTAEYQKIWNEIKADLDSGGPGNWPSTFCIHQGMPAMMSLYSPAEFIVTPETTYVLINHNDDMFRRIFTDGRPWPALV